MTRWKQKDPCQLMRMINERTQECIALRARVAELEAILKSVSDMSKVMADISIREGIETLEELGRYREALEQIATVSDGKDGARDAREIATEALKG